MTLIEINEKLRKMEETSLLELLNITAEDIVDRFQDEIEEKSDLIEKELEDE